MSEVGYMAHRQKMLHTPVLCASMWLNWLYHKAYWNSYVRKTWS